MASSSGGHIKRKPHFSCMEQPHLIKQLRGILSEYPDGGQILKELIQNADDADATELKIMLESRRINRDLKEDSSLFTKLFQAPALCIYNDAEFTDDDWRGIRMIDCSVKENDSLKVGRFGLGFKSVFHMTDYPCVISGDTLLLIDPHKPENEVNAMMKIDEIHEIEGMETSDILRAVGGKYGFDETVVEMGYFRGTMFWFPLRENASPISEYVYDVSKVEQLFGSLHAESSSILIFLKSITCLHLSKMTQSGHEDHVLRVQIQDEDEIRQKRKSFFSCIKSASSEKDIDCVYKMTITETTPENTQLTQWIVVNLYIVHTASNDFKRLIQSSKLGLSPCVGVAAKIEPLSAVDGHIFCFLPLPKEGTKLTGLPFHVNGYFALSKNRHHLKWATDDQYHQYVNDEILWNEKLLTEALPLAFEKALDTAIRMAVTNGNELTLVDCVYLWIPNLERVLEKWKPFIINALHLCEDKSIVFCEQFNSWKRVSDAVFTTFLKLPDKLEFVKSAVRKAIGFCGQCPVVVPEHVFLTYKSFFNSQINDISPVMLADILKQNLNYKDMTDQEKNELLAYLVSEGHLTTLEGLGLLPLASGERGTFERDGSSKYICKEVEFNLFPGNERHFIIPFERLDQRTQEIMRVIFDSKLYPIRDLDNAVLKAMLLQTLQLHLGPTFVMTEGSTLSINWLRDVWSLISSRLIREFLDISIFPILESGSFESSYRIKLVPLHQSELVLKSERTVYGPRCLNCDLEGSLRLLGITVIPQLPSWLSCNLINDFVVHPTHEDLNEFLQRKASAIDQHSLDTFNNAASESNKARFIEVFAIGSSINGDVVHILQKLELFRSIKLLNCRGQFVSADQNTFFVRESEQERFPVNIEFPEQCILVSSNEETVAKRLSCTRLKLTEFMRLKLEGIRFDVSTKEKESIICFFLSNIEQFTPLIDFARKIPFIQDAAGRHVKPSEIFDPFDNFLCRLFCGEHVFPADVEALRTHRKALTTLGMKGISNIRPDDVYNTARAIECRSENGENMCNKAKALQEYLEQHPVVIRQTLKSGATLGEAIKDIPCFAFCSPEECAMYTRLPKNLKWFSNRDSVCPPCKMKDIQFWELVCSSMPLVQTRSSDLSSFYDWNKPPFYDKILLQLQNIQQCSIPSESKLEFIPMIKSVYQSLSQHLIHEVREPIVRNALVWTDENFKTPSTVVVLKNEDDIDLKPYVYFLPPELGSMRSFFTWIGCISRQDEHVLVSVLRQLKEKYLNGLNCPTDVKTDLKRVQLILEKLAETNLDTSWSNENILMIVQSNSEETITFARLTDCVYDDDPGGFNNVVDIGKSFLVHEQISSRTAERLGVKSVTRKSLEGAQNIDQWGQRESFTKRLKSLLLNQYTDGLSVPKELLQNADDAGATEICFVYDERKHSDSRERLLSKQLTDFQGPAMWCYNNKMFSEKDFENITKFNNSAKVEDPSTIGKFGLGINTVYNITDIPSFISGADMLLFDPQEKYLDDYGGKSSRGKRIPLSNRHLVQRCVDQFKPFQEMFGCNVLHDPFTPYHGTLFRFPLRTAQQADTSEICQKVYSHDEIKCLFEMLIQAAEKLLLFCQNVSSIKLYHISALANSPHDMKMIYMVQKDCLNHIGDSFTSIETGVLRKAVSLHQRQCDSGIEEHHTISVKQMFFECESLYPNLKCRESNTTTWLVTWLLQDRPKELETVNDVPLVAVASPCNTEHDWTPRGLNELAEGKYDTGYMFCFLPLPINTGLPFHVHGCFNVSEDRQRLVLLNDDDKTSGSKCTAQSWNTYLLQYPLVQALLRHIKKTNRFCETNKEAYSLWPRTFKPDVKPFVKSFYIAVADKNNQVFCYNGHSLPLSEILILEENNFKTYFQEMFDFLVNVPIDREKKVLYAPDFVCNNVRVYNNENTAIVGSAFISKSKALVHFLYNISDPYWTDKQPVRNNILAYAMMEADEMVKQCFRTLPCIPTEPFGKLRSVLELIHPDPKFSSLSKLFSELDERFILKYERLNEPNIYSKLVEFGMNNCTLPTELVYERCKSLKSLARKCEVCTRNRMQCLLVYLAESNISPEMFEQLRYIDILPVLHKPAGWTYPWKGESLQNKIVCKNNVKCLEHANENYPHLILCQPASLYRMHCRNCVGSVCDILDETDTINPAILKHLGVKGRQEVSIPMLMEQLNSVGTEFEACNGKFTAETQQIIDDVYNALDGLTIDVSKDEFQRVIADNFSWVSSKPIVQVGDILVKVDKVAKSSVRSCPPYLYGLPKVSVSRWRVLEKLGVKECFCVTDIVRVLEIKADENIQRPLLNIKEMIYILEILVECMLREAKTYEDIQQFKECIIAPDRDGLFLPTYQLALEDDTMVTKTKLKLLHDEISSSIGNAIGVRTKRQQLICQNTMAIPFGQREELTTRLKGLLKDYPTDESIMKELIQNADDAGAHEIHFIKYFEQRKVTRSLEHGEHLQPALCIYNDKCFNDNDFEGIRNIGIGSKAEDEYTTGQFGVGFNAVYHITDSPSFLTMDEDVADNGRFCMFDPLFKHIDTKTSNGESGIMYNVNKLEDDFPDTITGFPTMPRTCGTMFRFPLRQVESKISDFCLTPSDVDSMLSKFKNAMPNCLHFLRHITKIKIRSFANGMYIDEYEVESEILSKAERKKQTDFLTKVKEKVCSAKTHKDILEVTPINVIYKMRIHDTEGADTTWLIVHQFGASVYDKTRVEQMRRVFISERLRLLPTGGVSLRLCGQNVKDYLQSVFTPKGTKKDIKTCGITLDTSHNQSDPLKWQVCNGKSYCFLPLPELTGLPFNVHGSFSVDRARRGLWDEGYRRQWNEYILSSVVTEALIEALQFLQKYWIEENIDLLVSKCMLRYCLHIYFSHFPKHETATNIYRKFFVEHFYRSVLQNRTSLFPIVSNVLRKHAKKVADEKLKCCFQIEWMNLATDVQLNDGGIIDTLWKFGVSKGDKHYIKSALRSLCIKLSITDWDVVKTMEKSCNISLIKTEPFFVMNTIKSRVQHVNCFVKDTVMKDTVVVKSILEYVKRYTHFVDEIEGLPLCVTNDNYLRTFTKNSGVFCSTYCYLLPHSFERFLHQDLVYLLDGKEIFESRILSRFTFQNLVEMLPCSHNPMVFSIGSNIKWKSNEHNPVDRKIISMLWKFIFEDSKTERQSDDKRTSPDVFKENVNSISNWAFLPSQYTIREQILHELIPIERAYTLLSEECVSDLGPVLEQVHIPTLDISVFEEDKFNSDFMHAVKGLTSSANNADELLRCIHYHTHRLESCNLSSDDAFKLLRVFDQHINLLHRKLGGRAKELLRELPLYETMQSGSFVNVAEAAAVIVSTSTVPSDGLNEWARNQGKVIVRENIQLKCLYKYIDLPQNNDLDMYNLHIFPNIAHMPKQYWLTHIEFVKDILLCKRTGTEFSEKQNQLIDMIKKLPFIDIGCVSYCADQLYDKTHLVFKTILGETKFLPDKYMDSSWKCFMEIIGLIIRPTGSMLIKYARKIARKGAKGVSDDLNSASDVIVSCLFGDFDEKFDEDVFNNIKDIEFVVPYSVPPEMSEIFPGKCSNTFFISFSGSCSSQFANVCWTSLPLVKRDPNEKIMDMLDIAQKPNVDAVITHCQNICGVFSDDFTSEHNQFKDKLNYMEYIYSFLEENRNEMNRQRLQDTPFILIPGETMIKASNVFITASERSELKPYLYKVPFELQRYIELFTCIGSTYEPTCSQYANVLNSIKSQLGDKELPSNILAVVSMAIYNFFEILCIESNKRQRNVDEVKCLYLPNEFRILIESSELIVADNNVYRDELQNKCRLNLFLGFNMLDINLEITSEPFKKLPDRLRPQFLSDVVSESISTQGMEEVFSIEAEKAQQFIHSTEFLEGVCRLLRHQNIQQRIKNAWCKDNEVVLQDALLSVRIKEVLGLRTVLCYKGNVVEGVSLENEFYVDKATRVETDLDTTDFMYCLYYQTDNASSLRSNHGSLQSGLMSLIEICTDGKLSKQSVLLLQQMLDVVPDEIGRFLDRKKITGLEHWKGTMTRAFPSPGTYVEEKFHPFMVQMIAPFKLHEYKFVAVEVEIDESDEPQNEIQPRYIYGHIERVLHSDNNSQLDLRYLVNLGFTRGGTVDVPIFRIFKFLPKTVGTSKEVVEYDSEPVSAIPFDVNCQRIMDTLKEAFENFSIMDRKRIIRRMMLRWHPDTNPDHEEYSNFIQNCTLRLERGEQLIIQSEPDKPDMRASRYWHTCVDATNTGKLYTRSYQDNVSEYNNPQRHGPFGNVQSDIAPVHSPGEYNRWIRQAKLDFQTGQSLLICVEKHPDTFNWICYICHQACEKALKAVWFVRDARKCPLRAHSLENIAFELDDDIAKEALEFEARLRIQGRDNFRLRYPDSVGLSKIPSEVFSKDDAEFAVATANKILEMVENVSGSFLKVQ